MLPYQAKWIRDTSQIKVIEKSRRIGISWAEAADSALQAAVHGGRDTWYVGYNRDMTEQFIEDVAFWARSYNIAASAVEQQTISDEGKDILTFRVRFASGNKVTALSSKPSNLRAKKGRVVIDEAAFHEDLPGLLKAATAILIWGSGSQICIISTHNGVDNAFNDLISEIKKGNKEYSLHRTTFREAIADGLYERIALVNGVSSTTESKKTWVDKIYADYGVTASEELDCEPFKAKAGKVFDSSAFRLLPSHIEYTGKCCRFWDFAATEKDVTSKDPCYTASVRMCEALVPELNLQPIYIIEDSTADFLGPSKADDFLLKTAYRDGDKLPQVWELEPGSASRRHAAYLRKRLENFGIEGVPTPPRGDKVIRAIPFANAVKAGRVYLVGADWNENYKKAHHTFPTGKNKDTVDASSGAYTHLSGQFRKANRPTARNNW